MNRPNDEQVALWYPRLFRTALRMTCSVEDAADLTQQAFCKALDRWDQFDGKGLPTTWLHSILVNCVRDWARLRSARGDETVDPWALAIVSDHDRGACEQLDRKEKLAELRKEVDSLPDSLRHAFIAVVLDGYTYRETAELLSVPIGTIASRINDARGRVHVAMRRRYPET